MLRIYKFVPSCLVFAITLWAALPCYAFRELKPNIILIYADDLGYNDLTCFGSAKIKTPNLDQMAHEGVRLTNYYSAASLCGPSRAAVMTGRHPLRVKELNDRKHFHTILADSEITIAELLKSAGYHTKAIGKWHLAGSGRGAVGEKESKKGNNRWFAKNPKLMPTEQGFDEYFGIPYSNDMKPSVLMNNTEFIESPVDQTTITRRYTDAAIKFIEKHNNDSFFIYLAHSMPHTPLYTEQRFENSSDYGPYGDCVQEIDFHIGRILRKLKDLKLSKKTFVVFTSDNGPWHWVEPFPNADKGRTPTNKDRQKQSGMAFPLRGAKLTSFEGGHRVPCIAWWPGKLPSGTEIDHLVTSMDFFPTFAALASTACPADRIIDGRNSIELLNGSRQQPIHEAFYYYKHDYLLGVRHGPWKLLLPRPAFPKNLSWYGRYQFEFTEPQLFNLNSDIGEVNNVAHQNPKIVENLRSLVIKAREDLGDANPYANR